MVNNAVLDQLVDHRVHRMGGDSKARTREASVFRDKESIDANQLSMGIHQRATGVARVDSSIGLNKSTRLASVIRVRVRTIDSADNPAGHGKAEITKRAADREYRLSRNQLGRITPGDRRQVLGVDL